MRPVHKELAEPVARGLLGAATVDGGPSEEQVHIIDALLHGYFDVDTDLTSLEPIDPAGLAAAIEDPKARHRIVELALQAMLVSATDGNQHFSNFCASLSLHEAGLLESGVGITPKVGTLARPGAAEELADAIRRGAQCTADFASMDHLDRVDEPLEDVRRELSIPARRS
jgi:hypothetical protein